MKVKIRGEDYARAVELCEWDPKDLDSAVAMIEYHGGVYIAGQGTYRTFCSQMVLDHSNNEAYFEVIVMGDPE